MTDLETNVLTIYTKMWTWFGTCVHHVPCQYNRQPKFLGPHPVRPWKWDLIKLKHLEHGIFCLSNWHYKRTYNSNALNKQLLDNSDFCWELKSGKYNLILLILVIEIDRQFSQRTTPLKLYFCLALSNKVNFDRPFLTNFCPTEDKNAYFFAILSFWKDLVSSP